MGDDQRPDEELIEDVKNGSMDSFKELYDRYKTKIYNFIYRLVEDKQSAEDCTQDVFIHLYKMAARYAPTAKFSSWLYKMAKNLALDMIRKRKIRTAVSLDAPVNADDDSASLGELLASQGLDPEKAAESNELIKLVRKGISKLNDMDKQIILLCDMERLSHKEVGEILDYSTETVTVKLYRARQQLAKILKIEGLI